MIFRFLRLMPAQQEQHALSRFFAFIIRFCSVRLGHALDELWHLLFIRTSPVLLQPASVFWWANASISVSKPELMFCLDSDFCMKEYGEVSLSTGDFSRWALCGGLMERAESQSSMVDRTSMVVPDGWRVADGRVIVKTLGLMGVVGSPTAEVVTTTDFSLRADMIDADLERMLWWVNSRERG
jgi:hypothetical protein